MGQLRKSGLVKVRAKGSNAYYSLNEPWPGFFGHLLLLDLFEWEGRRSDLWELDHRMLGSTFKYGDLVRWWRTSSDGQHKYPTDARVIEQTSERVRIEVEGDEAQEWRRRNVDPRNLVMRR